MTCKRVSQRARNEQDYYLFVDRPHTPVTEEQRLAFVRYDSHGGEIDPDNPVFVAKSHYGMYVHLMRDSYFEIGWPGGLELVREALHCNPWGVRMLIEAIGEAAVVRWLDQWVREEYE